MGWLWWLRGLDDPRLRWTRRGERPSTLPLCPCTAFGGPEALSRVSKSSAEPARRGQQAQRTAYSCRIGSGSRPAGTPTAAGWMRRDSHGSAEVIKTKLDITLSIGEWLNKLWNPHKMEGGAEITQIYYWLKKSEADVIFRLESSFSKKDIHVNN